ncbi:MAG: magnesium chelatase, partial [Bacteroidetes bacterium]|nr:magnesium chelatase [Bacteroidota bacterium]
MLSIIKSAATFGVNAYLIQIETNIENTIPNFFLVGLPDNAVKESRERVATAIKNSGFVYPNKRITINLAPADIKKEGSAYDLPIALGLLAASGQINSENLEKFIVVGELALDGTVRLVHGILPIAIESKNLNYKNIILPKENG